MNNNISKYGQVQANPTTLVIPSSHSLLAMIARAEAKCAESRRNALNDRAYEAMAINSRKFREQRAHNARRYINAGDRP